MAIALTALQVILGLIFLFTGTIKLTTPKSQLPDKGVAGFENIPESLIKWLALAEILGAVTLLIFSIPNFPKFPLQLSVTAFSSLMIAACYHHWQRNENKNIIVPFILFCICLIILFLR
jgi:hypothetical protein